MDERAWVLVVDDEDSVLKLMATVLQYAGYRVTIACDAHQALSLCQEYAPDLLVTDVLLHPDYSGCELSRNLRMTYPALHTLFVSGMSECDLAIQDIEAGRAAFLPKPFSPRLLADTVAALIPVVSSVLVRPSLVRR